MPGMVVSAMAIMRIVALFFIVARLISVAAVIVVCRVLSGPCVTFVFQIADSAAGAIVV